jgi:tRNA(Ile)-lysidine synthase
MRRTTLTTAVRRALRGPGAPRAGDAVVVGLSGGPDSVALTDALASESAGAGIRIVAAHLDHGLRKGSAADAGFCAQLCHRLGVPLRTGRAEVRERARREGGGLEEAARLERYAFLRSVKEESGASAIAVAHTRDDQAETLLIRLLRGSGSRGLASMRLRSGDLFRPLLDVSREQVLQHLRLRDLGWREDPSNADPAFARNRVRHELLPYLEARFNPRIRAALARSAGLIAEETDVIESLAEGFVGVAPPGMPVVLSRQALASAPAGVARAALRRAIEAAGGLRGVSKLHVDRMLALALSSDPAHRRVPLPGGREVFFSFREVVVGRRPSAPSQPARVPVLEARP